MGYPETFEGFAVTDLDHWSTTKKIEYTPKTWDSNDVDIKIQACGICGSDVHTVTAGWGKPTLPVITGHEVIGTVARVGDKVTKFKVGDRVGSGAQVWSCFKDTCGACSVGEETYCPHTVHTYNCPYPKESGVAAGSMAYGGYASHIRVHENFVFNIPEQLTNSEAAPMLCAGITVYAPLVNNGAGPGKKVGIVGIGGLGHFGIQFAKALGAEVYVFSRSDKKKEDAIKLGADHYIATENKGWDEDLKYKLDFIVSTANSASNFDLNAYLSTLKVGGKFIAVGLPEEPFTVSPGTFMGNACSLSSSHLGNGRQMVDMLNLAVKKGVKAWYEELPISVEGVKEGLERCHKNDVKYRFVLTDFAKQFD